MKIKFLIALLFILPKIVLGQFDYYNDFMLLSKKVHPFLVHLKGNIKMIDDSEKGIYYFKNQKLIKKGVDSSYVEYEYDKYGVLKKAKYAYGRAYEFTFDSITEKLEIQSINPNYKRTIEIKEYLRQNPQFNANHKDVIISENFGALNWQQSKYDLDGNLEYIKKYFSGGMCNYLTYYDKYFTKIYHGCCDEIEPKIQYKDFDKYGNWLSVKAEKAGTAYYCWNEEYYNVNRKYEYYE